MGSSRSRVVANSCDATEESVQVWESGFVATGEKQAGDVGREAEDRRLLGQGAVVSAGHLGGGSHEAATDGEEQDERVDLLHDAVRGSGTKLPLADVGSFEELVEHFGFPAHVVQLTQLATSEQ